MTDPFVQLIADARATLTAHGFKRVGDTGDLFIDVRHLNPEVARAHFILLFAPLAQQGAGDDYAFDTMRDVIDWINDTAADYVTAAELAPKG